MNMNQQDLLKLVKPLDSNLPFYRPFVSSNSESNYEMFLIGINPATPIDATDMSLEKYVSLLTNYDEFYKEYEKLREKQKKTTISRTRMGIINFTNDLKDSTGKTILETNIIPYPTPNVKSLKRAPKATIDRAKEIFQVVLTTYKPSVLIVHGKASIKYLLDALIANKMIDNNVINTKLTLPVLEAQSPYYFKYPDGKQSAIFICKHLMYHGKMGNSFTDFKEKIVDHLK